MEFQSGPNAPLKPVQIIASQEPQLKVMLLLIIKELRSLIVMVFTVNR
jgi:hypothetical protein